MARVEVNKQVPDILREDYNGDKFQLSRFRGEKHVLIVLNRGFM